MAGRRPLDRERVSNLALDMVETTISENGLAALNVRELASAVGCSVGSLYNIFGSLDRLVRIVNTRTLERLYNQMRESVIGVEGPEDQMAALVLAYVDFAEREPLLWRAVFDHTMPEGDPNKEWYVDSIERIAALAGTALAPLFKPEEMWALRRVANTIWSGAHGICSLANAGNLPYVTREDPKVLAESLVRGYLAGLPHLDLKTLFREN